MNLERLPEKLTKTVVIFIAMLLALYAGKAAGEGRMGTIFLITVAMVLAAGVLLLREDLWILIPACWPLTGRIPALQIPVAVRELVVLYVAAGTFILVAFKLMRKQRQFTYLDGLLIALVMYLVIAFVRHPVGFASAGSAERVGGRPYYDMAIAFAAYLTLKKATLTPAIGQRLPLIIFGVAIAVAMLNLFVRAVPQIVPLLAEYYTGFDGAAYYESLSSGGATSQRVDSMMEFGRIGMLALCAAYRPLSLLNPARPFRFVLFLLIVAAMLSSGYRNVVIWGGAVYLLGSYYRGGGREVARIAAVGCAVLFIAVMGQGRIFDLPFAAQRSLSFIPGNWDKDAVRDGEATADWRVQIWKEVFFTDRYIRDRILGDGFGMTRTDYELTQAITERYYLRTDEETQLVAALAGDYHSGPLSTLKVVGYVGVVFTYLIMFVVFRESGRTIRAAKGTRFFVAALFVGMPLLIEPFFFTFIFGGFSHLVPTLLVGAGMLGLVRDAVRNVPPPPQFLLPLDPAPGNRQEGTPQYV